MQRMDVESGDSFVALDGKQEVGVLGALDVLDGEVISNAACPIPQKGVRLRQRFRASDNVLNEIVESCLRGGRLGEIEDWEKCGHCEQRDLLEVS